MSNEANLYLLSQLSDEHLQDRYASRARSVAGQFAHMHNVRLRWLRHATPELVGALESFPRAAQPSASDLADALRASEVPVARFLEEAEASGKVKNWNGPPSTFLSYLVAHEAHHRALVILALRLSGHRLPEEVTFGQWDWGKKRSLRGGTP